MRHGTQAPGNDATRPMKYAAKTNNWQGRTNKATSREQTKLQEAIQANVASVMLNFEKTPQGSRSSQPLKGAVINLNGSQVCIIVCSALVSKRAVFQVIKLSV